MKVINFYHKLPEVEEFLDNKKREFDRRNLREKAYVPQEKTHIITKELGGKLGDIENRTWEYRKLIISLNKGIMIIKIPWNESNGTLGKRGHEVSYIGQITFDLQNVLKEKLDILYE